MRWRNTTFDDMSHLFRSFDNLFQRFLEDARFAPGSSRRLTGRSEPDTEEGRSLLPSRGEDWAVWQPAVECFTRDKNVVLRAELPGVQPDQVEVTVHNGRLILRGSEGVGAGGRRARPLLPRGLLRPVRAVVRPPGRGQARPDPGELGQRRARDHFPRDRGGRDEADPDPVGPAREEGDPGGLIPIRCRKRRGREKTPGPVSSQGFRPTRSTFANGVPDPIGIDSTRRPVSASARSHSAAPR
jgi:Molecular chaperone (small heat shock protein)